MESNQPRYTFINEEGYGYSIPHADILAFSVGEATPTFTKSRSLVQGDLVARSGNKFIRCGRTQTPIGVWRDASHLVILTLDNKIKRIETPAGVLIKGEAVIKVRGEAKI